MGAQSNKLTSKQREQIEKTIQASYNSRDQILNFNHQRSRWKQTLEFRDWSKLTYLQLTNCDIEDKDIAVLNQRKWPFLETLILSLNKITDDGVQLLVKHSWPSLKELCLRNKGTMLLIYSLRNIRSLDLCELKVDGSRKLHDRRIKIPELKTSRNISLLTNLHFDNSRIGEKGFQILSKAFIPQLKILSLLNTGLQNKGVLLLIKANWPNLQNFDIRDNKISFQAFCRFLELSYYPKLNFLLMGQTQDYKEQNFYYHIGIYCYASSALLHNKNGIKVRLIAKESCWIGEPIYTIFEHFV